MRGEKVYEYELDVTAGGVAMPRPDAPIADLFENVTLTTASPDYAWVNARQIWGVGTVDLAAGTIRIAGYLQ